MSKALARASLLKPEVRLAQAVSLFEADLSSDQKATFREYRSQIQQDPPGPNDVMRLTAEIDCHATRKQRGGRCFGPRMTNFLSAVQQFAAIGDVMIGGSQNLIACGVWSLVRMLLLSMVNFTSYLEKLSSLLMSAGRSAPRYQSVALLYPQSKKLQSHLSEYFIVVVGLCHTLFKHTQKSAIGQFTSSLSDSDLKKYQSDLDVWANTIKEEASLLEAQENTGFRAVLRTGFKSASHEQKMQARLRVLDSCSKYDYESSWKQSRKVGNANVFKKIDDYQNWKCQTKSCALLCMGQLGSGKSVLLANIIDDINLYIQSKYIPVAYFFCRHDIPESLKAETIIKSLVRQLLLPIADLTKVAKLLDGITTVPNIERLFGLLQQALPSTYKAYFVLDGLDECDADERNDLILQLRKLQDTFTILLCVSFRPDPNNIVKACLEQLTVLSYVSMPDDNPDIEDFIEKELANCIESRKLAIGDPVIILEIQDALLRGSQGMFLWVALQILSLCAMKTDDAIRQALVDLPKDLSEIFARILARSEEVGQPYQRRILELAIAAQQPLKVEELREALSVIPGNTTWNPGALINNIYSMLACCGSLVIVDEDELTVRLVHHSFKQFLLDTSTNIGITKRDANRTMAEVIVTYLNYGIFDTRLSTTVVPQLRTGSAPSKIIRSTLPGSVGDIALKLLKSKTLFDHNAGQTLAEAAKVFNSRSVDDLHFFSYARLFWQYHIFLTLQLESISSIITNLLPQLLQRKIVDIDTATAAIQALLLNAIANGREAVVKLLLDTGRVEADAKDESGQTPLWTAAWRGHEAIVKLLLDTGRVEADTKDDSGQTPLWTAVEWGHEAVVKLLLDTGRVEADTKDESGQTPLWTAAWRGHEAIVKLLLDTGRVEADAKDESGQTPLWRAVECGHEAIVKLLLDTGRVEADTTDDSGRTPLWRAVECGHEAIVKLLLDTGRVEADTKDDSGRTPLWRAVEYGHEAIVKHLLDTGRVEADATDESGRTLLSRAVGRGHEAVVKLLLDTGRVEADTKDESGRTPLWMAAEWGHKAIVKLLLDTGRVEADTKDKSGRTPLWMAAWRGHEAIVKLLLDTGRVEADTKDDSGRTPLWMAVEYGHEAIVKLLLDIGRVEADATDEYGQTPLSRAVESGH